MKQKVIAKLKQLIPQITSLAVVLTVTSIRAFAVNFADLSGDISTVLQTILTITGGGIAVFGIVHLVEAQSSQDPQQKSSGIKQMGVGLGIIAIANILIPTFMNSIDLG